MEIISYLEVNNYNLKLVGYNILRVRKKEERKGEGNGPFLKNISWKLPILPLFSFSWPDLSHIATREADEVFSLFSVATCYWSLFHRKK